MRFSKLTKKVLKCLKIFYNNYGIKMTIQLNL